MKKNSPLLFLCALFFSLPHVKACFDIGRSEDRSDYKNARDTTKQNTSEQAVEGFKRSRTTGNASNYLRVDSFSDTDDPTEEQQLPQEETENSFSFSSATASAEQSSSTQSLSEKIKSVTGTLDADDYRQQAAQATKENKEQAALFYNCAANARDKNHNEIAASYHCAAIIAEKYPNSRAVAAFKEAANVLEKDVLLLASTTIMDPSRKEALHNLYGRISSENILAGRAFLAAEEAGTISFSHFLLRQGATCHEYAAGTYDSSLQAYYNNFVPLIEAQKIQDRGEKRASYWKSAAQCYENAATLRQSNRAISKLYQEAGDFAKAAAKTASLRDAAFSADAAPHYSRLNKREDHEMEASKATLGIAREMQGGNDETIIKQLQSQQIFHKNIVACLKELERVQAQRDPLKANELTFEIDLLTYRQHQITETSFLNNEKGHWEIPIQAAEQNLLLLKKLQNNPTTAITPSEDSIFEAALSFHRAEQARERTTLLQRETEETRESLITAWESAGTFFYKAATTSDEAERTEAKKKALLFQKKAEALQQRASGSAVCTIS